MPSAPSFADVTPANGVTVGYEFRVQRPIVLTALSYRISDGPYRFEVSIWTPSGKLGGVVVDEGHYTLPPGPTPTVITYPLIPNIQLNPGITYTLAARLPQTHDPTYDVLSAIAAGPYMPPILPIDFSFIRGVEDLAPGNTITGGVWYAPARPTATTAGGTSALIGFEANYTTTQYIDQPLELNIQAIANDFQLSLPEEALALDFIEWDIEYSTSIDNAVFGEWRPLVTLPYTTHKFLHQNLKTPVTDKLGVTTTTYYRYRYRYRTKADQTSWSEIGYAGYPRPGIAGVNAATATELGSIQLAGDLTGTAASPQVADQAITGAKIANNTITDSDISAGASIALSKLAVDPLARANHTGTQTSATISDFQAQLEYIHNQATASNPWTIPFPSGWSSGRKPAVTIVDSGGTTVVGTVTYNTDNTITVTFDPPGAQFSGKAFLN